MSITDLINQKKQAFFIARDADKLELQKAQLSKRNDDLRTERAKLEEVRQLQAQVRQEEASIHALRTQGSRDWFGRITQNVKRLGERADENRQITPEKFEMQPASPFGSDGIRSTHAQSPFTKDKEDQP